MQLYVAILSVIVLVLSTKSEAEKTITMEDKENMDVNPEELGEKGDIVLPDRQKLGWGPGRWATSVIPYVLDHEFTNEEKKRIFDAMADYHRNTCVKFQPRNEETDYIHIVVHDAEYQECHSLLGHVGGGQLLNLERSKNCINRHTIIHELMHALGFGHEHQRPDRDYYIQVNERNIKEIYKPYFLNASELVNDFGFGYDYESVLHYSANSGTKNGGLTITVLNPQYQNIIGTLPKLSDIDIRKINRMFNCACKRK